MADYIFLKDKLEGEYRDVFEKVEIYSDLRNIDSGTHKEMMMDLLDLMLTAQKEGKPVEKIVGKNVEAFCKDYFSGYSWKNYLRNIPNQLYRAMWIVFVFCLGDALFGRGGRGQSLLAATTDVSPYILGFFGGLVILTMLHIIVKPLLFRWKRFPPEIYGGLCLAFLLVLTFGGAELAGGREVDIPLLPLLLVSGLYVLGYIIIRAVRRYLHHGSVRRQRDPWEMPFGKQVMASVEKDMPQELVKKYEIKNRLRVRFGKEPLAPEEYMEKLRKENKVTEWMDRLLILATLALCVGNGFYEGICNSALSGVAMGAVMLLCEIPVFLFIRFLNRGLQVRVKILHACEQQGIDILEYARRHKAEGC